MTTAVATAVATVVEPALELDIVIRPARPSEHRLVQARWGRRLLRLPACDSAGRPSKPDSQRGAYVLLGGMAVDRRMLSHMHVLLVDEILARPETRVAVATLPDVDEPIAWVCWEGETLHFVDVLPVARRCRVAQRLVHHTGCSAASHVTPEGRALLRHLRGTP